MNGRKRITIIGMILLAMLLLSAFAVSAASLTDFVGKGLRGINNFLQSGRNNPYLKTIDFVFFSMLFVSVYMVGAKYGFKELKRPEKTIAVLLGLMTAFLLVLNNMSVVLLLPYINWVLYVLLFLLFWKLLSGIKTKIWKFLLALLLTLLVIWFVSALIQGFTAPSVGRVGVPSARGFFGSLKSGFGSFDTYTSPFKKISFPSIPAPKISVPDISIPRPSAPRPPTPGDEGELEQVFAPKEAAVEPASKGRSWGWLWWVIAAIAAVVVASYEINRRYGVIRRVRAWRRGEHPEPAPAAEGQAESVRTPLEGVLNSIGKLEKAKSIIRKAIASIEEKKEGVMVRIMTFIQEDREELRKKGAGGEIYRLDPDSDAFKALLEEEEEIRNLLDIEKQLEKLLNELLIIENETIEQTNNWYNQVIGRVTDDPTIREKFDELRDTLSKLQNIVTNQPPGISKAVKSKEDYERWLMQAGLRFIIGLYINLENGEMAVENELEDFLSEKNVQERAKDDWSRVREKDERKLVQAHEKERLIFSVLNKKIDEQLQLLKGLRQAVKSAEDVSSGFEAAQGEQRRINKVLGHLTISISKIEDIIKLAGAGESSKALVAVNEFKQKITELQNEIREKGQSAISDAHDELIRQVSNLETAIIEDIRDKTLKLTREQAPLIAKVINEEIRPLIDSLLKNGEDDGRREPGEPPATRGQAPALTILEPDPGIAHNYNYPDPITMIARIDNMPNADNTLRFTWILSPEDDPIKAMVMVKNKRCPSVQGNFHTNLARANIYAAYVVNTFGPGTYYLFCVSGKIPGLPEERFHRLFNDKGMEINIAGKEEPAAEPLREELENEEDFADEMLRIMGQGR
ncbi:hypothetical protein HYX09_03920 [Candidatus Woesearchaeota archaeon]|nr:hypothetical protein [Candidatus Woesearchaeota archaeon]